MWKLKVFGAGGTVEDTLKAVKNDVSILAKKIVANTGTTATVAVKYTDELNTTFKNIRDLSNSIDELLEDENIGESAKSAIT